MRGQSVNALSSILKLVSRKKIYSLQRLVKASVRSSSILIFATYVQEDGINRLKKDFHDETKPQYAAVHIYFTSHLSNELVFSLKQVSLRLLLSLSVSPCANSTLSFCLSLSEPGTSTNIMQTCSFLTEARPVCVHSHLAEKAACVRTFICTQDGDRVIFRAEKELCALAAHFAS